MHVSTQFLFRGFSFLTIVQSHERHRVKPQCTGVQPAQTWTAWALTDLAYESHGLIPCTDSFAALISFHDHPTTVHSSAQASYFLLLVHLPLCPHPVAYLITFEYFPIIVHISLSVPCRSSCTTASPFSCKGWLAFSSTWIHRCINNLTSHIFAVWISWAEGSTANLF